MEKQKHLRSEIDLAQAIRLQQGMTVTFKKIDGRFIHTLCAGELVYQLGFTPDQVIGKDLYQLFPKDFAAAKECYYRRAWEGEEKVTYEGWHNHIHYLASLRPVKRNGAIVEVIASCVDISERKKAEIELSSTRELLESFFESSLDAIDVVDLSNHVIRINSAFEQIYGWSSEEVIGRGLPFIPCHMAEHAEALYRKIMAGEQIKNYETVRQCKDGRLIDVSLTVFPVRNASGSITGYAGISRDITEKKQTEAFLRKTDKLNVIGHLAAGVAHEIRNPLTSLRGFVQLLRNGYENKLEFYDIMLSEIDMINHIVTDFLMIAKPQTTDFKRFHIGGILKQVIGLLRAEADLRGIVVRLDIKSKPSEPVVHCAEFQIRQVFIKLLQNAIEAMPEGGTIFIEVENTAAGTILIRFLDQGGGIPKERLPKLGEPFYTTKEKGTGLGLMMCFRIIEAHGGHLLFDSQPGRGTSVEIRLPAAGI
ncbi:histidine kinase [Paenibacillus darwinianus]|uniref:histidine kinase n=1 Tax=Paenibacillus darwinianus TaxID=1380763 RepID=A0A9W5W7S5_9BACL|nr:PAS domain S-box protein [Paenibacillus darwinianus]EXX87140.1 histidine kinase [Paenibacillus darwinianus]EXX88812.1 histidine kinase [Paenibacillus darwinianus]EXX89705.1 histidine kinase [Paenibacillus darwinianus]